MRTCHAKKGCAIVRCAVSLVLCLASHHALRPRGALGAMGTMNPNVRKIDEDWASLYSITQGENEGRREGGMEGQKKKQADNQ